MCYIYLYFSGEDIRSGYPFDLCTVDQSFEWCSRCPWPAFCRGCVIPRDNVVIAEDVNRIAVDWKPTALYLRYQHSVELVRFFYICALRFVSV